MVLTVSFVLSPVIGLCCHRRLANTSARLERQRRGVRTTRLRRPQARALVRSAARVHRIPPRVRDDRDTPLEWGGMARNMDLIWGKREEEYFCKRGWTQTPNHCPRQTTCLLQSKPETWVLRLEAVAVGPVQRLMSPVRPGRQRRPSGRQLALLKPR
jgi:hypothetical protein